METILMAMAAAVRAKRSAAMASKVAESSVMTET
jgi:hypothetical protein